MQYHLLHVLSAEFFHLGTKITCNNPTQFFQLGLQTLVFRQYTLEDTYQLFNCPQRTWWFQFDVLLFQKTWSPSWKPVQEWAGLAFFYQLGSNIFCRMNRIDVLVEIGSSVKDVLDVAFLGALLFAELAIPSPFDRNKTFPVDFLETVKSSKKCCTKAESNFTDGLSWDGRNFQHLSCHLYPSLILVFELIVPFQWNVKQNEGTCRSKVLFPANVLEIFVQCPITREHS